LGSFGDEKKKATAKDFSLWLDITSSTFILALLLH